MAGTRVLDIAPGVASSNPLLGFEFDGGLAIWARSLSGSEPWICDIGLTTATPLVDASPGPASSAPYLPDTQFGGSRRLVLYVDTSIHGAETWITDGTPAGTVLLGDVRPGPIGSFVATATAYPTHLTCGSQLVWLANDGVRGAEPWSVSLPGSRTRLWDYGPRRFDSGDPVLGTTMSLRASRLAPTDLGVVAIGLPAVAAAQIAPGRFLHVDPNTAFSPVVILPSAGGTWTGGVAVVNNPSLIGLEAIMQPVFLAPTLPLGLDVGDALWLTLGP